jgi:hypothetical protein
MHLLTADVSTDQGFELGESRGREHRLSKFFRGFFMQSGRAQRASLRQNKPAVPLPATAAATTTTMVSFVITAIDRQTVNEVKEQLKSKVTGLVDSKEIRHDGVRRLFSTSEAKIKSVTEAAAVSFTIGEQIIILLGLWSLWLCYIYFWLFNSKLWQAKSCLLIIMLLIAYKLRKRKPTLPNLSKRRMGV